MTLYRKIEFYRISYEFLPIQYLNKNEEELKDILINTIYNSIKPYDQHIMKINEFTNSSVLIEIIDIQKDHLFGIIGRLEDLKDGILKRFRSKEDGTIIYASEQDINYYVENYTYFYIRFTDLICAVLSNSSAPRFKTNFCNFLKEITKSIYLEKLNIINVYDDHIEYKIDKIKKLSEIRMLFDDNSTIGNRLLDLEKTFYLSQSTLKEAKIELTLEMSPVTEKTKELFRNKDLLKSDFKKVELIGTDEMNEEIEVELIEQLLTKKVLIDIDEKYLKSSSDLEKIKEALVKVLPII